MKGLKLKGKVSSVNPKYFEFKGKKGVALEIQIKDVQIEEMLCVMFDEMAETAMEYIQEGDTIKVSGEIIKADNGTHILRPKVLAMAEGKEEESDE